MSSRALNDRKRKLLSDDQSKNSRKKEKLSAQTKPRHITINDLPVELTVIIYSYLRECLGPSALSFCMQRFSSHAIPEIVRCKVGCDIINAIDEHGNTAIFYAWLHPINVMEHLLAAGANINYQNLTGRTVLHFFAVIKSRFLLHANRAITACININARDNDQKTALHLAVAAVNPDFVCLLLEHNADVSLQDVEGKVVLHVAATVGSEDIVKILLENNADVSLRDLDGKTALHCATSARVIELLLENGADINLRDVNGMTILHEAAKAGDVNVVRQLLRNKVDVNLQDVNGDTALHFAAVKDADIVRLLLEHGADVNIRDAHGKSALHVAAAATCLDVIHILHSGNVDLSMSDMGGRTALHVAAASGDADLILFLLQNGAEINALDFKRKSALHIAVEIGDIYVVYVLVNNKADVGLRDSKGRSVLHLARRKQLDISCLLIAQGAQVNVMDRQGNMPLHGADESVTKLLLKHGAIVDARNINGITALHVADTSVAKILISNKAKLDVQNTAGATPLHNAVTHRNISLLNLLVQSGAKLDMADTEGKTPLHYAVEVFQMKHALDLTVALLARSANCNSKDIYGKTPLHYAAKRSKNVLIAALLDNGARSNVVDIIGKTALHYAAEQGSENTGAILGQCISDVETLFSELCEEDRDPLIYKKELPSHSAINGRDSDGNTALMQAIRARHYISALALLVNGADVNISDNCGCTPLMAAVTSSTPGDRHIPAILTMYGSNVTRTDEDGKTAFHYAAKTGKISDIPVSHSENINDVDAQGDTALHYAVRGRQGLSALLERGADVNIQNNDGSTILHLLSETDNVGRFLVHLRLREILTPISNVKVNLMDRRGKTALDLATLDLTRNLLVAAGAIYSDGQAPINLPDRPPSTAFNDAD